MGTQRNSIIDVLRGMAIIFVIFGHITHIETLRTYIWGFHIPIFFFISGWVCSIEKQANFLSYVKKCVNRILIPYIFFYLITFLYWVFIERNVRGFEYSVSSQFIGLFYGTYNMDYMMFNGALWFLPCLFSMEVLYGSIWFSVKNICKKNQKVYIGVICLLVFIVALIFRKELSVLPLGFCASMIGCVFFYSGSLLKETNITNRKFKKRYLFLSLLLLAALQYILLPYTGADLAVLYFKYPLLYMPIALLGIILYYIISYLIKRCKILEYLGKKSLVFFALQEPVYRAVIFVVHKISSLEVEIIRTNLIYTFICTILTILVIIPFVWAYFKYIDKYLKRI